MWQHLIISIGALLLLAIPVNAQIFGGCQSYGGGGSSAATPATVTIEVVTGQLTSAQIKAIKATPISILSAMGGSVIAKPLRANTTYHRVTSSYTGGGNGIDFEFNGITTANPSELLTNTSITAAGDRWGFKGFEASLPASASGDNIYDVKNLPVKAINSAASEYATGSGNVSYELIYTGFTFP
jgi:hypothetical protein